MRARRSGGVARQAGNAATAAFTARSTSAASANGTALMTSPVAGLVTTPCRPLCDAACCPLIHSGTRATATEVGTETVLVVDIEVTSPVTTVLYSPYEAMAPPDLVDRVAPIVDLVVALAR